MSKTKKNNLRWKIIGIIMVILGFFLLGYSLGNCPDNGYVLAGFGVAIGSLLVAGMSLFAINMWDL
jgi:hypothetical protein